MKALDVYSRALGIDKFNLVYDRLVSMNSMDLTDDQRDQLASTLDAYERTHDISLVVSFLSSMFGAIGIAVLIGPTVGVTAWCLKAIACLAAGQVASVACTRITFEIASYRLNRKMDKLDGQMAQIDALLASE